MGIKTSRPINGVSYGINYVVTTQDATDKFVLFNFQVPSSRRQLPTLQKLYVVIVHKQNLPTWLQHIKAPLKQCNDTRN